MRAIVFFTGCAVLSAILTWVVLSYSLESGRLAIPPDYDDSHSLVEGGLRYLVWKQDGAGAAWHHYVKDPPHSFLHYYLATAFFSVFGVSALSAYAAGGIFVLLVALGAALLLESVGFVRTMLVTAALLCLPAAFNVVHDFRSECALAALLFAGCCAVIRATWNPKRNVTFTIVGGLLFALALGIKPSMFIYVLGVASCCSAVLLFAGWLHGRGGIPSAIKRLLVLWAVMVVPFSFHFILNAESIFGYILTNAFVSDVWKQKGTFFDQLIFHFAGFPGAFQLGVFQWPLVILTAFGLIWSSFPRSASALLRPYLWSVVFLTLTAYAGVAINAMNNNHFGMTFHLLLGLSAALSVALIAAALGRLGGTVFCGVVAAASLWAWGVPVTQNFVERTREVGGEAALAWRREGPKAVFEQLRKAWTRTQPPAIWVAAYGWSDGNTITWEAIQGGLPWKAWNYYSKPIEPGNTYPAWADILVIPEPGLMGTIDLPLLKDLPGINQAIQADPSLELVGEVLDPAGKAIRIFIRRNPPPNAPQ